MTDSGIDFVPAITPEDQFLADLANRPPGGPPNATPPQPPSAAPTTTPPPRSEPPAASPAAAAPPAPPAAPTFPDPNPAPGFELVEDEKPAMPPLEEVLRRAMQRPGDAPPATPPKQSAIDTLLASADTSDEAKAVILALREELGGLRQELSEIKPRVDQQEQFGRAQLEAQADAEIDSEREAVASRYHFTAEELDAIEERWERASKGDSRLAVLTFEEATRRIYGDALAARLKTAPAPPAPPSPPNNPPGAHAPGHLVSDASAGAPVDRGKWTPPQRDRGATMGDAYQAARAAIGSR